MAVHGNGNPATHFGRQIKKERLARGWTLRELAARTGIDFSHLSRIESGKRPPTEAIADAMDRAFLERRGWFREYFEDSKSAIPPGLRSWAEREDTATTVRAWMPGIIHGFLQTSDYARAVLETYPGVADEVIDARLTARMQRQQRVLFRDDPPKVWFVVDEVALYRFVGSPEIMAAQCAHLLAIAQLPHVSMQILPAVAHPANASELIVTDDAAYVEHLAGGLVYTEPERVSPLERLFTTIQGECFKASESAARIQRMRDTWNRLGGSPATQMPTADRASKSRRHKA
jgi:transcriptional regulator with XRE-family HTH domain